MLLALSAEGKPSKKHTVPNKTYQKTLTSKHGVVLRSLKNKTLKSLGLKKGDVVYLFNGKPLSSQKDFLKKVFLIKKGKKFSIQFKRKKKVYQFVYKSLGQKKYKLVKKSHQKSHKKKLGKSKKKKNIKKKVPKKKNVLNKYKGSLQNGYVLGYESLIYKKPNFDAEQIFYLKSGTKVLMSKKIFTPSHRFGTFYKVFIKKPKKIVGFISEVDVIPEYKRNSKDQLNPKYKIVEKQLKEGAVNLDPPAPLREEKAFPNSSAPFVDNLSSSGAPRLKNYIGFSFGADLNPHFNIQKDIFIGVKLSGKNLILPNLVMDINLDVSSLSFFHGDILLGYSLINSKHYSVYFLGGIKTDLIQLNENRINNPPQFNLGPAVAFAFLLPFQKNYCLRLDLKMEYGFLERKPRAKVLTAFQIGF